MEGQGSSGGADNIDITANGRVALTTAATAVTLDSNNDVTIDGAIDVVSDDDGGIGVHVVGGNTGNLTISGPINVGSESDPVDNGEDEDAGFSDLDGPSAIGGNRIGVLVDGTGSFVGDIYMDNSGSLIVRGNDSAGLRVLTSVDGDIRLEGTMSIVGDRSAVIDIRDSVSGDLALSGSITARGEDTSAVSVAGNIGGGFYFNGAVATTGASSPNRQLSWGAAKKPDPKMVTIEPLSATDAGTTDDKAMGKWYVNAAPRVS